MKDRLDNSLTDSKYVIIRHANSTFNFMISQMPENGVLIDGEIHVKEREAVTNLDHLDAKLSEIGVLQANDQAKLA